MGHEFHCYATSKKFSYSRENRKFSTDAEKVLWIQLRNRKLHEFRFRRQHPISGFIVDFYCHECKLIVEIDGEYHNDTQQSEYDKNRSYDLEELKIKVIRFTNSEVLENIDFVLDEIGAYLLNYR